MKLKTHSAFRTNYDDDAPFPSPSRTVSHHMVFGGIDDIRFAWFFTPEMQKPNKTWQSKLHRNRGKRERAQKQSEQQIADKVRIWWQLVHISATYRMHICSLLWPSILLCFVLDPRRTQSNVSNVVMSYVDKLGHFDIILFASQHVFRHKKYTYDIRTSLLFEIEMSDVVWQRAIIVITMFSTHLQLTLGALRMALGRNLSQRIAVNAIKTNIVVSYICALVHLHTAFIFRTHFWWH